MINEDLLSQLDSKQLTAEEAQIYQEIEKQISESRLTEKESTIGFKPRKTGLKLPLFITLGCVTIFSGAFYFFQNTFKNAEQDIVAKSTTTSLLENKLIAQIKQESEKEIEQRKKEIEDIKVRLETTVAEKAQIEATIEQRVASRRAELENMLAVEIQKERERLLSQQVGEERLKVLLKEFEERKRIEYEAKLSTYKTQLTAEIEKKEGDLRRLESEYNSLLANKNNELERIRREAAERQSQLTVELRNKMLQIEQQAYSANQELQELARKSEQTRLYNRQVSGFYLQISNQLKTGNYVGAQETISNFKKFLLTNESGADAETEIRSKDTDYSILDAFSNYIAIIMKPAEKEIVRETVEVQVPANEKPYYEETDYQVLQTEFNKRAEQAKQALNKNDVEKMLVIYNDAVNYLPEGYYKDKFFMAVQESMKKQTDSLKKEIARQEKLLLEQKQSSTSDSNLAEIEKSKQEIAKISQKVTTLEKANEQLTMQNKALSQQLLSTQSELSSEKTKFEQFMKEANSNTKGTRADAQRIADLEKQLKIAQETLTAEKTRYEQLLSSGTSTSEKAKADAQKIAVLETQLKTAQDSLATEKARYDQLINSNNLSSAKTKADAERIAALEIQLKNASADNKALSDKLSLSETQSTQLRVQIEDLQKKNSTLNNELATANQLLAINSGKIDENSKGFNTLVVENELLKKEKTTLLTQVSSLQTQLNENKGKLEEALKQNSVLNSQTVSLQDQVKKNSSQLSEIQKSLALVTAENETLKGEKASLLKKLSATEQELQVARTAQQTTPSEGGLSAQEAAILQKEIDTLKSQLNQNSSKITDMQKFINSYNAITAAYSKYAAEEDALFRSAQAGKVLKGKTLLNNFLSRPELEVIMPRFKDRIARYDKAFESAGKENVLTELSDFVYMLSTYSTKEEKLEYIADETAQTNDAIMIMFYANIRTIVESQP